MFLVFKNHLLHPMWEHQVSTDCDPLVKIEKLWKCPLVKYEIHDMMFWHVLYTK